MLNNYAQWVVVLFQDEVFLTFWQFRLPHWFFTSFFCVPAVGWNGANTASKALTRSQWALPSKTTWWYLCFFQFCIRDYLGYCRLYAKSDLVQAKNLKVWTTLDIWSSKLKTSNFAIDPPGWRRLQTSQFSRESITVTSSPRTGSLMISSNF